MVLMKGYIGATHERTEWVHRKGKNWGEGVRSNEVDIAIKWQYNQ